MDTLRRESAIYSLETEHNYTYKKAVNDASFALVIEDLSLLNSRKRLHDMARDKVHNDGYPYKKKVSRTRQTPVNKPKRQCLTKTLRAERISQLKEDINEINLQIQYTEVQRDKMAKLNNFDKAIACSERLADLRKEKRAKRTELETLNKKANRSKREEKNRVSKAVKTALVGDDDRKQVSASSCGSVVEILDDKTSDQGPLSSVTPEETQEAVATVETEESQEPIVSVNTGDEAPPSNITQGCQEVDADDQATIVTIHVDEDEQASVSSVNEVQDVAPSSDKEEELPEDLVTLHRITGLKKMDFQ